MFAQAPNTLGGSGTATPVVNFTVSSSGQVVPEPSTYALLSLGAMIGLVLYRRKINS